MVDRLKGKVALVTGIAAGIGKGIALRFAAEGATVFGTDINAAGAEATVRQAAQAGTPIEALFPIDLTQPAQVRQWMAQADAKYGRADVLVNAGATAVSRTAPKNALPGVAYVQGSISYDALLTKLAAEHDVVVVAMRAADGVLSGSLPALAKAVSAGKSRWGHINGAGSALVAPGGPRLIDTPEFPAAYKAEAAPCASVFDWLRNEAPAELNWFAITPAAGYSSSNPGEALGRYRKGGDVLVVGDEGKSYISGADFALAFVDEIAAPTLHRARTTVGY